METQQRSRYIYTGYNPALCGIPNHSVLNASPTGLSQQPVAQAPTTKIVGSGQPAQEGGFLQFLAPLLGKFLGGEKPKSKGGRSIKLMPKPQEGVQESLI